MMPETTYIYDIAAIRCLEQSAITHYGLTSTTLMHRAGAAALDCLLSQWPNAKTIAVLCGGGNNGGDGYVLAHLAMQRGLTVKIWQLAPQQASSKAYLACQQEHIIQAAPLSLTNLSECEIVVDAIYGIGCNGDLPVHVQQVIALVAQSNLPVLAIDIPSGVDASTGQIYHPAIKATVTITFLGLKSGLCTGTALNYVGQVITHNLDLPKDLFSLVQPLAQQLNYAHLMTKISPRSRNMHKGEAGHVLLIGGDHGGTGAIRLAAEAALRVGAGLATLATRPEHASTINCSRPELMCHGINDSTELMPLIKKATVIVIGPGLGQSAWAQDLFNFTYKSNLPLILDADALNLLAHRVLPQHQHHNWILTPHLGEAARLLNTNISTIAQNRYQACKNLHHKYGGICILKGAGSLIASTTDYLDLCPYGNPGMASGGMGDLLSGIIGSLVAQGLKLHHAAQLGLCLHAQAADIEAKINGERGMLASDLLPHLRKLTNNII